MPPHRTAREHGARIAIGNTVRIRTGPRVKAGRKAPTGLVDLVYGDIFGQEGIHSPQPPTARQSKLSVRYGHANVLGHRMHAGIGTTRTRQIDRAAQQRLDSAAQLARNGRLARLLGKSAIGRAIIGNTEYKRGIELRNRIEIRRRGHGRSQQTSNGIATKKEGYANVPLEYSLCRRNVYSAVSSAAVSSTASTFLGAAAFLGAGAAFLALGVQGSVTSSMITMGALSPLRLPSFMMRV